jgi:PKD repeat protein
VATNSSFGITGGLVADYPIWCALYDSLGEAGIISAGATDNRNTNVDVTGDIPSNCASNFLIIVTNSNQQDDHYAFSAYGNQSVDIAAPGTGILSTTKWVNGGYGQLTGTSMATPHVAGTVALMHAAGCVTFSESTKQQPANTALSIRSKLLRGVDTLSPFEDLVSSRGRLNLFSAVGAINAFPCILDTFPQAEFASNKQGICEGDTVKYADISFNNTQRNWTFNGAQPSTSNDSTPLVLYNNSGKYGVQLIAKNAYGGDTLVWKKYITVSARPAKPTILASGNKLTSSFGEAYQWFDSTGKKVGAQKNLTPAKAGKYIVEISNAFGCKTKSEVYNFFPVGINLLPDERARLSIYPSPADDFIKLENVWCSNSVEVINANGQYVYSSKPSQESFIIDTHLWPQGIYIIRNGDRVTKVAVLH